MKIFKRKISKKNIEQFEFEIAQLLKLEFPQLIESLNKSKLFGISFIDKPKGIYISRGYSPKVFEKLNKTQKTHYNLNGILVLNRKTENYESIKLNYLYDTLTKIEIENPKYFHKDFNLKKIKKTKITLEHLNIENPDKKKAEKALKSLNKNQIKLLELDDTFEIEFDEDLFYTIIDFESGNYLAVDKKGKIYFLNHDNGQNPKLISNTPIEFFEIYNGDKKKFEKKLNN